MKSLCMYSTFVQSLKSSWFSISVKAFKRETRLSDKVYR